MSKIHVPSRLFFQLLATSRASKALWSRHIAHNTAASFRAIAVTAFRRPIRAMSMIPQRLIAESCLQRRRAFVAMVSSQRACLLPHLVIPPLR